MTDKRIEDKAIDFLHCHRDASQIVVDTETGLPFKAIYSGLAANGVMRTVDAVYYFSDHWGGWQL